ncbi:MAG TPA: tetratricopeptide repeat protein [Pyrinomonadaceae bacterium]|jgi:tetratricopeptide (TPR) repeat protein
MHRLLRQLSLALMLGCACAAHAAAQTADAKNPAARALEEGNRYARMRQYDKAVESFRQAIKLEPNSAAGYNALGRAYLNMGRASDALEPAAVAAKLDPDNAGTHLTLGLVYASLRRRDEALAELRTARRLDPNDPRIHNELGNVLHNAFNRLDEALAAYQEAHRLLPNEPNFNHNIGLTLVQLGRYADAVGPLQDALRVAPQYRNARYLLGEAYHRTGRWNEAIEAWGKFLEIVPNGPDALTNRLWDYLYLGGHGREAAADARQFLEAHGWREQRSAFMVILAHLGYRDAGMAEEADAVLAEATQKLPAGDWPQPVVRYLQGELSAEELLRLATDNDRQTEARAYLGLALRVRGEHEAARTHFEWVREYGNKHFFEYPLALEELKRLGR